MQDGLADMQRKISSGLKEAIDKKHDPRHEETASAIGRLQADTHDICTAVTNLGPLFKVLRLLQLLQPSLSTIVRRTNQFSTLPAALTSLFCAIPTALSKVKASERWLLLATSYTTTTGIHSLLLPLCPAFQFVSAVAHGDGVWKLVRKNILCLHPGCSEDCGAPTDQDARQARAPPTRNTSCCGCAISRVSCGCLFCQSSDKPRHRVMPSASDLHYQRNQV